MAVVTLKKKDLAWLLVNLNKAIEHVFKAKGYNDKYLGVPQLKWHKLMSKQEKRDIAVEVLKDILPGMANKFKLSNAQVKDILNKHKDADIAFLITKPLKKLDFVKDIFSTITESIDNEIIESVTNTILGYIDEGSLPNKYKDLYSDVDINNQDIDIEFAKNHGLYKGGGSVSPAYAVKPSAMGTDDDESTDMDAIGGEDETQEDHEDAIEKTLPKK